MKSATQARYTRFVSLSKQFLWVLVAGMISLIVWVASDNSSENGARLVFSNMAKSVVTQNIMDNPHYQGVDGKNRPYTVAAETATQLEPNVIALMKIRADISLEKDVWVALNAGSGTINLDTKQLELADGVDVFYGDGYEFRTDHVTVDIDKGNAYGDATVEGQGPIGTLRAKGFVISDHGNSIRFNDSVRIKLYR